MHVEEDIHLDWPIDPSLGSIALTYGGEINPQDLSLDE
jgi:hypothetical protein